MSRLRSRFFGIVAVLIAATALCTAPAQAAPAPAAEAAPAAAATSLPIGYFGMIENINTRRCLSVRGATAGVGSAAFQLDCVGYADQYWAIEDNFDGTYRIFHRYTKLCLAVQASNNVNGAPAFLFTCVGSYTDQKWRLIALPYGPGPYDYWYLQNAYTGRCLAVRGANNVNEAPVFQFDCAGYTDQRWF